jgi:hypothetical protein
VALSYDKVIRLPARREVLRWRATKIAWEMEGQHKHLLLERAVTLAIAQLHVALAQKFPGKAYALMANREASEGQALGEAVIWVAGERRQA